MATGGGGSGRGGHILGSLLGIFNVNFPVFSYLS